MEWIQHILRMEDSRITNQLTSYRPQGQRDVGRPSENGTGFFPIPSSEEEEEN